MRVSTKIKLGVIIKVDFGDRIGSNVREEP